MPTEFASAIADLRLSPEKLSQDAASAQRQLLRITQQIEANNRISLRVALDVTQAQRDLAREVTRLTQRGAFNIPVGVNADAALNDLAALQDVVDPLSVPVTALTDQAADDILNLQGLVDRDPIIVPFDVDPTGAQRAIDSVVDQTLPNTVNAFGEAGEESGRRFTDRLTSITSAAVGSLSLALGAYVGTALVTGFQRLTTIEDATASLTVALQSATEAANTLDDVLGVVTGTPYNLDQFATAASNLISFGVEAQKVPFYLTAIGEAAANRGSRANEFAQRLADTFGQISIQGRILGEDLLSLQAAGVDALSILGNQFNVTTSEVQDLLREGVVPVGDALDALSDGILNGTTGINGATIAFAGTMESLRQTLTGSIGGFQSATARFGVAIIDPLQDALTTGFGSATDIVNKFNEAITDSLSGFAETEGFQNFVGLIAELPDKIDPLIDSLSGLGPALAPLAAAFGAAGLGQLAAILGPLGRIVPPIGGLTAAIIAFVATTPEIRDELLPVLRDLAETAAITGVGLAEALSGGLEAVTPLVVDFIEAIGDFTPLIRSVAQVGVALANGLVPVLDVLAGILDGFPVEVLTAIGAGFLAFKAIDALRSPFAGVVERLDSVSLGLYQAEADAERFGTTWTAAADKVGLSSERVARANDLLVQGLNIASVAAVGFFSGIATASDNATVQITGFIGATTGIVAAFAQGGAVGGLVATAATIGGALVGMWQNSKQAAEEYRDLVEDVAASVIDDLGAATAALIDANDLVKQISFQKAVTELVGEDQLRELDDLGIKLANILDVTQDPQFSDNLRDQIIAAQEAATAAADAAAEKRFRATGAVTTPQQLGQDFADAFLIGLQGVVADNAGVVDLSQLITTDDLGEGTFRVNTEALFDFLDTLNDVEGLSQDELTSIGQNARDAKIQFEAQISTLLGFGTAQAEQFRERVDQLGLDYNQVLDDIKSHEADIAGLLDYSKIFPNATLPSIDNILDLITDVGDGAVDIGDGFDYAGDQATGMADAIESALADADRATQRLDDSLKDMLDTLDRITEQQDFAAGFRDIGAALDEITNLDALKDAEKLIDDIGRQREDIADLEAKIAEEQGQANAVAADLDRRIAEAAAAGSKTGLAALQAERDKVFNDLGSLQSELGQKQAELSQFQAELSQIDQVPVTLGDLLQRQANENGLSLFEFLIAAPTDEAKDFFQKQLAPQIEQAATLIQRAIDDSPLLASIQIPDILDQLASGLANQGLDPGLVGQLVDEIFDPTKLATEAVTAFEEQFNAQLAQIGGFTEQILKGEKLDPSVDVNAIVSDVGDGIADLQALQEQGVEIPGDIDLKAAQATLDEFQNAVYDENVAIVIPIEGDISGIIADIEALQQFALSLSSTKVLQNAHGGGRLLVQEDGGIVQFFRNGGITENHIAQLHRHGTIRAWMEPETGGEAYIPLAPSKRTRSEKVLGAVAAEFGMALTRLPSAIGVSPADIEDAVYRGSAKGVGALQQAGQDYDGSVIMHNYFPDGTSKSKATARDIRRRFVTGRGRGR